MHEDDSLRAELETGLRFDEFELDKALVQQADLFYRVAQGHAWAVSVRDAAKQALAEAEAQIDKQLRAKADTKVREGDIEARKTVHPVVQEARDKLLDATEVTAQWAALKEAYVQRSHALANMVDLYVAGYFADRSTGRASRDVRERRAEVAKATMQRERVRLARQDDP